MPTARKPARKKASPAEVKRRAMATKKHKPAPKSPLAKKKITNKETAALMAKESKARKLKREVKKHMKKNRPSKQKNYA